MALPERELTAPAPAEEFDLDAVLANFEDESDDSFESYLDQKVEKPRDKEEVARFSISDSGLANWALRKLGRIDAQVVEIDMAVKRRKALLDEWAEKRKRPLLWFRDFLVFHLRAYLQRKRDLDPGLKSEKLIDGTLQFKAQQPVYTRNDAVLLDWLEANDLTNFIKIEKKVDWAGLKAHLDCFVAEDGTLIPVTPDGVLVDGLVVTPQDDAFYAKPNNP